MQTLNFDRRYCGPPASTNGGIAAGTLAEGMGGAVKVRLIRPVPYDQDIRVRAEDNQRTAFDEDGDIYRAWREPLELDVPMLPDKAALEVAAARHYTPADSQFDNCFVCGHKRPVGQGLRIHTGCAADGEEFAAALWRPHADFANDTGALPLPMVWGSMDCPGAVAAMLLTTAHMLTGEMHVQVFRPVLVDRPHTVLAWPLWTEGRKIETGTALFDEQGDICAKGKQLWITVSG